MYFEEFASGQIVRSDPRLVTGEDLKSFLQLSGLTNPIFMSLQGAKAAGHKAPLVPAPMQLSLAMGLGQSTGIFDHVVAVLGFDEMRFINPVYSGDSLCLTAEVLSTRPTSNPARGLVVLGYRLDNQEGKATMTCRATYLMRCRMEG